jgi:hypothetical protein
MFYRVIPCPGRSDSVMTGVGVRVATSTTCAICERRAFLGSDADMRMAIVLSWPVRQTEA